MTSTAYDVTERPAHHPATHQVTQEAFSMNWMRVRCICTYLNHVAGVYICTHTLSIMLWHRSLRILLCLSSPLPEVILYMCSVAFQESR